MRKRQDIWSRVSLGLMVVAALTLATFPMQARAQLPFDCATASASVDMDADGLTDLEECTGITLADGSLFRSCIGTGIVDRSLCLDPTTRDLFVILVRASPSRIPANPLLFITQPQGGLAISTHEITPQQASGPDGRNVTAQQKALRVTESLDTNGQELGISNYGPPPGLDFATVFTRRISNFVNSVYGGAGDVTTNRAPVIDTYIRHTIAHEIGHMVARTDEYVDRFGGYHYKSGSDVIMEQSVVYTVKRGNVNFAISTNFALPDQTGLILK